MNYKKRTFCLTRMVFGLNSAPRNMTSILKTVLGKRYNMETVTNSYVNDILRDETVVKTVEVVEHLTKFGLATKPPQLLEEVGEELTRGSCFQFAGWLLVACSYFKRRAESERKRSIRRHWS